MYYPGYLATVPGKPEKLTAPADTMSKKLVAPLFALSIAVLPLLGCEDSPLENNADIAVSATDIPAPTISRMDLPSIVDIAIGANPGEFNTLVAAVVAADLVETLDGLRQFTVFAPTDEAFAALGLYPDNIGSALDKATLTNILLCHVAPGKRLSEDVVTASRIRTMSKGFIMVDGTVLNGDVNIVAVDIEARNGVIHVIDAVLLP
jgi:uncharacterized surface protein with fasciclin (FAS1) repeats